MDSWGTLDALTTDFESYLDSNYSGVVPYTPVENNPLSLNDQDEMSQIAGIRISMYEIPINEVQISTGSGKQKDWNQGYQMQLFMRVARAGDYDTLVEQELMAFKDLAYQWQDRDSATFDVNTLTSGELYSFNFSDISQIRREASYSEMTIDFGAYRSQL